METERKDTSEDRKRKGSSKSSSASPSRSGRTSSTAAPSSPAKARKEDASTGEHAWISATFMKSPRGPRSGDLGDPSSDDSDHTLFEQEDEAQENFFTLSASGFLKYYEKKQFIDCIVVNGADNTEYHAHKMILAYSSHFFFDAFKSGESALSTLGNTESSHFPTIGLRDDGVLPTATSSSSVISDLPSSLQNDASTSVSSATGSNPEITIVKLPWTDTTEILPLILHYMYTGQIALTPQNCVLISAVAERLQIPKLQTLCKDYIHASLQRENAVELLLEASKYKAQNLLKRSISNVARNFCHIKAANTAKLSYQMFLKVLSQDALVVTDEYSLFQVVCTYCEVHKSTLTKSNILKLMSHVRFRWLSYEQFVSVTQNPIVPKSLLIEAAMARLIPHELAPEEAARRTAALPTHLQQRPKFSIHFEFSALAAAASSPSTSSSSLPIVASTALSASSSNNSNSGVSAPNTFPQQVNAPTALSSSAHISSSSTGSPAASTNPLHNPISGQADLASILASSSSLSLSSSSNSIASNSTSPTLPPDIYQGVIGWIATNSNRDAWKNAHVAGRVKVHSSSLAKGSRSTLVDKSPSEVWTNDTPCSWISIDLGPFRKLKVTHYTLRHGLNFKADSLRTWDLQGSNDGINWKTLKRHTNDKALNASFACASWPVPGPVDGYRFFRIMQTGHNSSNHNFLALSGFEFYGWLDISG